MSLISSKWYDYAWELIPGRPLNIQNTIDIDEPTRILVKPTFDLFSYEVKGEYIHEIFKIMRDTPQHIYYLPTRYVVSAEPFINGYELSNVWLGSDISYNQTRSNTIFCLLKAKAAGRFILIDPIISNIDMGLDALFHEDYDGTKIIEGSIPTHELIDWVIIGGSDHLSNSDVYEHRIRRIIDDCRQYELPCYVTRLGEREFDNWPDDLKVREFPGI